MLKLKIDTMRDKLGDTSHKDLVTVLIAVRQTLTERLCHASNNEFMYINMDTHPPAYNTHSTQRSLPPSSTSCTLSPTLHLYMHLG